MGNLSEQLQSMKDNCYSTLKISYNSEGKIMTRTELNPRIRMILLNSLNFAINFAQLNDVNYSNLIGLKDLLSSEKL